MIVNVNYENLLIIIGKRLKAKRLEKNLSQNDLASLIDCEIKSIQRIEKGKMNMSLKMFISITNALELPPEKLLNEEI